MDIEQAKIKIKLWLFESSEGMLLLDSVAQRYSVKVNVKTVEDIRCVGVNSYEVLLDCTQEKEKIPIIVFARFADEKITYHSILAPTLRESANPKNGFKLKFAELLYTVAFRLISEDTVNVLFGYGCVVMAWLLSLWLVYWVAR